MNDLKYLVAIHRALGLTFLRYKKIAPFFANNWQKFWNASISELMSLGLNKKELEKFLVQREKINPEAEILALEKLGVTTLFYENNNYPLVLKNIYNPPVLLFARGKILPHDFPSISVVGSRLISAYGERALEKIVSEISHAGITIVSGLALGTDVLAHKAALKNGGRTIAVLGNAIDSIYPANNKLFAEEFLTKGQGVVLSEYLPGTPTIPANFPQRNRIVSGLSRATIIIEAAEKSGSLITGKLAIDQNKELFVVPGSIFSKTSAGTNKLMVSGEAFPALSGKQVLNHLNLSTIPQSVKKVQTSFPQTGVEGAIIKLLSHSEMLHIDDIIKSVAHKNAEIVSALAILEIKGFVKNVGKQIYHINV